MTHVPPLEVWISVKSWKYDAYPPVTLAPTQEVWNSVKSWKSDGYNPHGACTPPGSVEFHEIVEIRRFQPPCRLRQVSLIFFNKGKMEDLLSPPVLQGSSFLSNEINTKRGKV